MSFAALVLGWTALVVALAGSLYSLCAARAVRWFFSRPAACDAAVGPVTILKPLHGDEPGLAECLEGFCAQDYPAAVQIVFGVREACDSAIPVVRQLIARYPELDFALVIDPRIHGTNLKLSNLINMNRFVKHPVIVVADSDVSVERDYLSRLMQALAPADVGFVTSVYFGVADLDASGSLWSRLSAMAINYHFLPSVALGLRLKLAKPCFGPTMAFRGAVLEQAGGFARFADRLADDFEIGRAIRDLGYGFAVPPMTIGHGCPERSVTQLASHELRWARTVRLIDPFGYAGSAVLHPLAFALTAVALLHGAVAALATLAVVFGSRLFLMAEIDRRAAPDRQAWWLWPARDLLSTLIYLSAYLSDDVTWRGRRFRIDRTGGLEPRAAAVPSPPSLSRSRGKPRALSAQNII